MSLKERKIWKLWKWEVEGSKLDEAKQWEWKGCRMREDVENENINKWIAKKVRLRFELNAGWNELNEIPPISRIS